MKTQNIKGKLLSNQITTRNTKEKKAGQVELARKLDANTFMLRNYRARKQGPLMWNLFHVFNLSLVSISTRLYWLW